MGRISAVLQELMSELEEEEEEEERKSESSFSKINIWVGESTWKHKKFVSREEKVRIKENIKRTRVKCHISLEINDTKESLRDQNPISLFKQPTYLPTYHLSFSPFFSSPFLKMDDDSPLLLRCG